MGGCIVATRAIDGPAFSLCPPPSSTLGRRKLGFPSSLPAWKCRIPELEPPPCHCPQTALTLEPMPFRRAAAGLMLALGLWVAPPSLVATVAAPVDVVKTYTCLLKECRQELARCIIDPGCASNLACIESCNGRPDDAECQDCSSGACERNWSAHALVHTKRRNRLSTSQIERLIYCRENMRIMHKFENLTGPMQIGCGNLFQNSVVDQFNQCVVSRKKCVSQRPDDGSFPAPSLTATVKRLKLSDFDGEWYISSGLNPTFDIFDCQLHNFSSSAGKLTGNLTWRVKTSDDGFISRTAVQNFVQDSNHPGLLYNHNNELLHYQEDWYILSAKTEDEPDDYIFIYYRGKNDAWSAYGGAVVYTRTQSLPSTIKARLKEAAWKAGLDFSKFQDTNNSCKPQPPLLARLGKRIEIGEQAIVRGVREIEKKVGQVWD